MAHRFTAPFWNHPLEGADIDGWAGIFEPGEIPDPDRLVELGWWVSADGTQACPPGSTPPGRCRRLPADRPAPLTGF